MLLDLLRGRYSCRSFSQKPVPEDVLAYMLECGRLSASGGNEQPWKFGVVTQRETIRRVAQASSVNYSQRWIESAPLLIVLCSQLFEAPEKNDGLRRFPTMAGKIDAIDPDVYAAVNMEEHQTKIPGEHMVLAALEHGVYSTWISSVDCEAVSEILGLRGYLAANVIAFGYPAKEGKPTPKKALEDIVFHDHFT